MIIQIPIFLGLFYVVRDISTILETIKAGKEIAAIHYSDIYSFLYLL
jgi:membrane protein insertase Oxa1/YidC/SpoIIIJ